MSLEISNLNKTYRNGVKAIDDLGITIEPGMFGILGPNGAGKSTLMRTIATLQHPDSGELRFDGVDILKRPIELRKQLGYLPQDFGVYPKKSAEKLLHYFASLKGIASKRDRNRIVDEVLELTNLHDVRKKHVSSFSGGMKQRFGIAQMLLNKPKLIIVDEPTSGLDPAERKRFLNVLREISLENTVLFSTHLVEDVQELCTDLAIINHGKILKHAKPSECLAELEGKIWIRKIDPAEIDSVESVHRLLSSKFNEDNSMNIRIFSPTKPEDDCWSGVPNLEDVYFINLSTNH